MWPKSQSNPTSVVFVKGLLMYMLSLKGVLVAMQPGTVPTIDKTRIGLNISLCKSIQELIAYNQANSVPSSSENGQYVTHLTSRQHTTVAKPVGKRCIINCKLNDIKNSCAIPFLFLPAHQKRLTVLYWALMSLKKC